MVVGALTEGEAHDALEASVGKEACEYEGVCWPVVEVGGYLGLIDASVPGRRLMVN